MTIRIPTRRLARPAAVMNALTKTSPFLSCRTFLGLTRSKEDDLKSKGAPRAIQENPSNTILEEYLKKTQHTKRKSPVARPTLQTGTLPQDTIFDIAPPKPSKEEAKEAAADDLALKNLHAAEQKDDGKDKMMRNKELMAPALDPDPINRQRWERKMVIRTIKRRGRLTKMQLLKRTERESLMKTPFLPTSVKKLTKIANQVAGKPIEEALVQMRFSKKKVARDVYKALQIAKSKAIVERGMGLGKAEGRTGLPVEIELKDGKKRIVKDRTSIYVDQAWVGRGSYTPEVEYRAMGKRNILRHPQTSISFLLKEEATRIRLSEERQKKRDNRKLWVQLPNRPITAQRQYCLW
ncbi:ribosomal protein L22 [Lepidopterella palustris CBS 459.81]|uniref:Ribosomal protein L22 n=1 Tax=Lepidopterella palustris CBS 459.81 TaxID=1314670 RepID=A0A8E2E9T8_9PEZI|nr:ribosomal protein L22 [Lepidopterella palustris CBS 459.81]